MLDKKLFEEKTVAERKLSKYELAEKQAVASKYGVRHSIKHRLLEKQTLQLVN